MDMKSTRSEQERQEVAERFLGQARLDRYRRELPDLEKALALHSWNQEYAGALHVILSYAEIALRNSIDHALSQLSTSELGTRGASFKNEREIRSGASPVLSVNS